MVTTNAPQTPNSPRKGAAHKTENKIKNTMDVLLHALLFGVIAALVAIGVTLLIEKFGGIIGGTLGYNTF